MSESIFDMYGNLWLLTQQMLDAARNGAWDVLVEIQERRCTLLERIAAHDGLSSVATTEQHQIGEIIRRILVSDEEIKTLTEAWMGELQEILSSIGTERNLHKAYEEP